MLFLNNQAPDVKEKLFILDCYDYFIFIQMLYIFLIEYLLHAGEF